MIENYDDIIELPHYDLRYHKRMSMEGRAAQFSSFAALTGHKEEIAEAGRLTSEKIIQTDARLEELNRKLNDILQGHNDMTTATIVHFVEDTRKAGGEYVYTTGSIRMVDLYERKVIMDNEITISIDNIFDIFL